MFVIGTDVVARYFKTHAGHKGINATRTQYYAWLAIVGRAQWRTPAEVKASYPKASILKGSRVVFNIKLQRLQTDCKRTVSGRSLGNPILRDP